MKHIVFIKIALFAYLLEAYPQWLKLLLFSILIDVNIFTLSSNYESMPQTRFNYNLLFALKHLRGKQTQGDEQIHRITAHGHHHPCLQMLCKQVTLSNGFAIIINNDKLVTGEATNQFHKGQ